MIRPVTCICFAMAVGSGLYLYQAKDAAQVLDRTIEKTVRETEATRDQTRALRTEWTLLNEPDRLRQLAQRYLPALQPVAPTQFANLSDLASRLPPPQVNPPSDQAPLPDEGGPNIPGGTSGSDPVIAQPGSADDLPLPPLPPLTPQPIIQIATGQPPLAQSPSGQGSSGPASVAAAPARPVSTQAPTSSASGTQAQLTAHDPAATRPTPPVTPAQPQGPRMAVPEPRPVTSRPVDAPRQTESRPVSAPVDLRPGDLRPGDRSVEPRPVEPPRPADSSRMADASRTAEARGTAPPRPVTPVRPVAPAPVRPTPVGGSLLGMARDGAGVPLPRPVPANVSPGQWPNGGG